MLRGLHPIRRLLIGAPHLPTGDKAYLPGGKAYPPDLNRRLPLGGAHAAKGLQWKRRWRSSWTSLVISSTQKCKPHWTVAAAIAQRGHRSPGPPTMDLTTDLTNGKRKNQTALLPGLSSLPGRRSLPSPSSSSRLLLMLRHGDPHCPTQPSTQLHRAEAEA